MIVIYEPGGIQIWFIDLGTSRFSSSSRTASQFSSRSPCGKTPLRLILSRSCLVNPCLVHLVMSRFSASFVSSLSRSCRLCLIFTRKFPCCPVGPLSPMTVQRNLPSTTPSFPRLLTCTLFLLYRHYVIMSIMVSYPLRIR
jgi:hypothetical protein